MDFITREIAAYILIGGTLVIGLAWYVSTSGRRKREKLRRRGVKKYGH